MKKTTDKYRELTERLCDMLGMERPDPDSDCDDTTDRIYEKCRKIKSERDLYYMAMDNCSDSFHITDGDGKVIFVNKVFEKKTNLSKSDMIGARVDEIEKQGIYSPSVVRIVLEEKRQLTMVQSGFGFDVITTATPVLDSEGNVLMCVSNARFTNDLIMLKSYYEQKTKKPDEIYKNKRMIAEDDSMKELFASAAQIASADSSVMISGETGTGKSMIARYIHDRSPRAKKRFVELNCASIPENLIESELFGYESGAFTGAKKGGKPGMFEIADGGTLFLDEIGDMPISIQAKLLSAIQNRRIMRIGGTRELDIDVRIITATNRDLEKMVSDGLFRSDLYYRINVVPLRMPALRERKKDIDGLTESFLEQFNKHYNKQVAIMDSARRLLNNYRWPGNIRELENLVERLVVTSRTGLVYMEDLPASIKIMADDVTEDIKVNRLIPLKKALEDVERQLVEMAFNGETSTYKAAETLGISQSGASRKYIKYMQK